MMQQALTISAHDAAVLIARLARRRESAVSNAAKRHEGEFYRAFLRAVREAQASVPMDELIEVLSMGIPGTGAPLYVLQPVFDGLIELTNHGMHYAPYMRHAAKRKKLSDIYLDTLKSGAEAVPFPVAFDVANPEAVLWAEANAARLVMDVTASAQQAIRTVITEGIENGVQPADSARLIRASIGLTERDAAAVMKAHLKWVSQGKKNVAARAERYAAKLTRSRALTIARTETMRASNEGQAQLWQQAQNAGYLDSTAKKTWLTSDPCPICAPLDGEVVGINESFSVGQDPPLHPNCRCTIGLVA